MKNDNYMQLLARYTSSIFLDFENYLRTEVGFVEMT